MREAWVAMERSDLEDARRASDEKTLSERADEAVALYLLTLSEQARRLPEPSDLLRSLDDELPTPLSDTWKHRSR